MSRGSEDGKRDDAARSQSLKFTVSQIEKQFGKGAIMTLGENLAEEVVGISTGSPSLDLALGGRGVPRGRITEIFGAESSGKTTLTLHIAANAQKEGGVCAFIDAEHALDPSYAKKLGVDFKQLLVSQPDTGEQALEIAEMLVRSNAVDVIIIDSVAALVPMAELEGEMGDSHVGLQARLMSQALRKLTAAVSRSRCCLIFINQIREKIGVMFGSPETTTGGRALKFYSSVRLEIKRIAKIKEGEEVKGNRTKVTVVKNKIAPPFRSVEFDILFDQGISLAGDLLDLGVSLGVVDKTGSWFSFGEERMGQGRERTRDSIQENSALRDRIWAAIRQKIEAKDPSLARVAAVNPGAEDAPEAAESAEEDAARPAPRAASSRSSGRKTAAS